MWRYKLVRLPGREDIDIPLWEARLNELGGEGWEAVSVIPQTGGWCVLFKMPHEVAAF